MVVRMANNKGYVSCVAVTVAFECMQMQSFNSNLIYIKIDFSFNCINANLFKCFILFYFDFYKTEINKITRQ